jgi:hypothetical protein
MNLQAMMNDAHHEWQDAHYRTLLQKKFLGKPYTAEEREWLADYYNERHYNPCPKPTTCPSCGKDLSAYGEKITGCPSCHSSFVE